ncbi:MULTISPECIES: pyrroline-5-carboxylate reductase [Sulfurimonas]|uniref:Pyrroline-5-carboxylate reductase n=1 Tax=Sulfurimonas diazotrophicus TaxID=3131939 RepID=A0ABZ3HA29_9BACT
MKKTLTFIGNGNMAVAMAKTLKERYLIEVVGRDLAHLDTFEAAVGTDVTKHLLNDFDITGKTLLLCVKPANIVEVGTKLHGKAEALYSVLAGTKVEMLKSHIAAAGTVRAMPNLAATVGRSMTTLTGDRHLEAEAISLFDAIGMTLWLGSEKELDIATGLAGSGPAYLALIAEALADGAVKQGLKRDDAMTVMRGLFAGFGELIQHEHPALLKDGVMSPGGTTAAGYSALEAAGVRNGCIQAVERAFEKARSS